MATRPDDSFVSQLEQRSVEGYRRASAALVRARHEQGVRLRPLSTQTGIAISVLTAQEQGNAWPRFHTLAFTAQALGHRVQLAGGRVHTAGEEREDPAALEASWLAAGLPGAYPWQILIGEELRHRMIAAGMSKSGVARAVGLRHNTVTEMYYGDLNDFRFASVRTLSVLSAFLRTELEVVPATAPW